MSLMTTAVSSHHGAASSARGRDLEDAPRIAMVDPEMIEAVALAEAHARHLLRLPPLHIVWCSRPGGYNGQTLFFHDGRVEVRLNAAGDMSPRETAWTLLHEFKHAADGPQLCGVSYDVAEARANAFAFSVVDERRTLDFCSLDWRRPSMRRRERSES